MVRVLWLPDGRLLTVAADNSIHLWELNLDTATASGAMVTGTAPTTGTAVTVTAGTAGTGAGTGAAAVPTAGSPTASAVVTNGEKADASQERHTTVLQEVLSVTLEAYVLSLFV